jgi:hypothetical protein
MKRVLYSLLLAVAASGAQAAMLFYLGGGRVSLALPLVLAVWAGREAPLLEGVASALAVGLVVDVFAGGPLGLLTSLTVALALGSRVARAGLAFHGPSGFAAFTAVGTWIHGTAALACIRMFGAPEARPAGILLWRVLVEAIFTGLAAGLAHRPLSWMERALAGEAGPSLLKVDR